jgi:hypothetical protein
MLCNEFGFSPGENTEFRDLNHSRASHLSHVLYQGTTLVGPYNTGLMRPLGPEVPEVRFFPKGNGAPRLRRNSFF